MTDSSPSPPRSTETLAGGATALVIEDSPTLRRAVTALVEGTGMFTTVLSEENGLSGFSTLRRQSVDVVLCDVNMPVCDGLRFLQLKAVDASLADVPVIMLTGDDDVEQKVRALELGACDYVSKAAAPAEVRARLGVHLKLKRASDELKRQRVELERLTRTDALTGLANRRCLDEALERELARCSRYDRPMSVVMVDLDHFKQLNDRHGHQAGDHVLREVAEIIRRSIRKQDLGARYGGEELTVVMPETPLSKAALAAERIRATIAETAIEWAGQRLNVTASLGVAGIPPVPTRTAAELVQLADGALYRAKSTGRNRVVLASADGIVDEDAEPDPAGPQHAAA